MEPLEASGQEILRRTLEYQKILARIVAKIRSAMPLDSLCASTSQDISRLLRVERVSMYRFHEDWSGNFVQRFGFAQAPWDTIPALGTNLVWEDSHLQETKGGRYRKNEPFGVADIYEAGHSRCHLELLEQFQVRAYAIAPIFVGAKLWGLLSAYQHSAPRPWDALELDFLCLAGGHLGAAMQQAELRDQFQQQTLKLENAVARQRALTEVVGNIRSSLDTEFIFQTACRELCTLLKLERSAIYRFDADWSGQFISNFGIVAPQWESAKPFGSNPVWQDSHLQDTRGGRYRNNESFAVSDIYTVGHSRCHIDVLEQFKIRAYAIVPIFIGPRLWGLLSAYHHSGPRQWENYEVEFLSQVATQLGVAIQQTELLEQSKRQSAALQDAIARQRALTEVVSKMRASLDINSILATTCQEAVKLLKVERIAVYQFNADWSGQFVSQFGIPSVQGEQWPPVGKNMIWEDTYLQETKGGRYRNNESLAVADIYQERYTRCHLDLLEQYKVRAYALTPIFVGRTLWGMVAAYQHSGPRPWDKMEVEFLAQIATQLSVAIQNAELLTSTQSRADDLHQSAEQSRILFDVVSKIRESLDLQTIFKTMVTEMRRSLKADRVGVYEFDLDSKYNEGHFVAEDVLGKYPSALGSNINDHCFGNRYATKYSQGRIYTLTDLHAIKVEDCYRSLLERFEIRAVVIAPIMKGGTLWGLLCIHQCSGPRDWTELEVQFVKQVATQLSVALQQSDLLAQTREQTDKIGQTLNDLQQAQLQIIQSEKMAGLGQLVAGVAHEINNPVSYIHGNLEHAQEYLSDLITCIRLYQTHYPEPPLEVQEFLKKADMEFAFKDIPKLLQSMRMGTDRICEIVASLRNFSRLDEAEFKTVNIHDGIDSTLMLLQNRLKPLPESPEIKIVKDYQALPLVECYPGQLNQVFMNLLANSIDALEDYNQGRSVQDIIDNPSMIRISTSINPTNQWVTIGISDNGPGMTAAVCNQLFDPFFTTKSIGKGTGLGLSISYQIVTEKHNGKLYCTSEPGKGTEFVIEIPVHQVQE